MANEADRPRERLLQHGAQALSDAELLQVLVNSGSKTRPVQLIVQDVLATLPNLGALNYDALILLRQIKGLGPARAATILAGIELGKRVLHQNRLRYGQVKSSADLAKQMFDRFAGIDQEFMIVLFLDVKHQVIADQTVAKGALDAATVDPRIIFREALKLSATNLILVHNHPSGDPTPSEADHDTTTRFQLAATVLGLQVIDHLIIGTRRYFSFAESDPAFQSF